MHSKKIYRCGDIKSNKHPLIETNLDTSNIRSPRNRACCCDYYFKQHLLSSSCPYSNLWAKSKFRRSFFFKLSARSFIDAITTNNYLKRVSVSPAGLITDIKPFPLTLQFFGWVCWYENDFREMCASQEVRMYLSESNRERWTCTANYVFRKVHF